MTKCRQSKIRAVIAVCSRESEQTWKNAVTVISESLSSQDLFRKRREVMCREHAGRAARVNEGQRRPASRQNDSMLERKQHGQEGNKSEGGI